ncbi:MULTISPECIES: hypothetical protein [unclassified Helicobacter]|nr:MULTISPECIES: hypothetical protein [unclassified Helicobacter]
MGGLRAAESKLESNTKILLGIYTQNNIKHINMIKYIFDSIACF